MAKLDGVKVVDMIDGEVTKITYKGEEYINVGKEDGQGGDIGLRVSDDASYASVGEYYPIIKRETTSISGDNLRFKDDEGGEPYVNTPAKKFVYFRKVSTPTITDRVSDLETRMNDVEEAVDLRTKDDASTTKSTTSRTPQLGDKIRVVDAEYTEGKYDNGDILTVESIYNGRYYRGVHVEEFNVPYIGNEEFEIIDDYDPRSAFEGVEKVRLISGAGSYPLVGLKNGNIYNVTDVYWKWNDNERIAISGGECGIGFALPSQLEAITETLLSVGDFGKVVPGGYLSHEMKNGDIVEIIPNNDPGGSQPYNGKRITDGFEQYFQVEQLTLATDEEVAKFKPEFSVGDYAKVVGSTVFLDIERGTFVKVTKNIDGEGDYRVDLLDDSDHDYAKPTSLEKLSDEEAKRVAPFVRAGREIGEFKPKDIARVVNDEEYDGGIGELVEVVSEPYGPLAGGNVDVKCNGRVTYILGDNLELVTPVESRVDTI